MQQAGWSGVKNGKLLALAAGQFDVIFTVDRDFANLTDSVPVALDVVILEVGTTDADLLFPHVGRVRSAIAAVAPGQVVRLTL